MVNDEPQRKLYDGSPLFYVKSDGLYAWEIDGRNAYKSAEQYQRAMCFAETPDGNAYAVDWFRVSGGKSHLYSFHGPPGTVATDGLALVKQSTGTLAGADVPFAAEASSIPKGFSYLYDVEKTAQPAGLFQATWKAEDGYRGLKKDANLFIKMHSLADCDSVALADGDPPQNKAGNPRRLRYALLRREGDNLKSLFAAVYEPYKQKPFIKTVDKLTCNPPQGCEAGAVRIALVSGEEDYLISNPAGTTVTLNNGLSTDARFAFLRLRNGKPAKALMVAGTSLAKEDWTLSGTAELSGRLVKFHKDAKGPANAWLEMNDPACAVAAGQQVIFQNHGDRNAFYDVKSAEKEGNLWKVETTAASFVNGFQDEKDYEQGFSYNVAEGNLFTIPLVTQWNASSEKATATK